ncbi:MBL fold metallo-hydrolase [Oligoflexaceae bacterium]|nr:MBL fold metallo-hydrolase [Oligoflexaceae bacterium]
MIDAKSFYHQATNTLTYVVFDTESRDAVVIDPVADFDGRVCSYDSAKQIDQWAADEKMNLHAVLETHIHADHWTAAHWFKTQHPRLEVVIGKRVEEVATHFSHLSTEPLNYKKFSRYLEEGADLQFGTLVGKSFSTPGHTPVCQSFLFGNYVFVGDLLFMPDSGCGRCDFPGGSAEQLYDSVVEKIFTLDPGTQVMTGHDYQPGGRDLAYSATVAEHKSGNVMINDQVTREEFLKKRKARDSGLNEPKLLQSSLQINLLSGELPEADEQGRRFLRIPFQEKK